METTLSFKDDLIDKEVSEKLSKEVSSYIIEQLKNNMDNNIEERAKLASEGYDDNGYSVGLYMGYKVGATKQKEIDEKEIKQLRSIIEQTASVLGIGTKWFNEDARRNAILKLKQEIFNYLKEN